MDYKDFNEVKAWRMKCFEVKEGKNGIALRCSLSGKKKDDGTYPKSLNVSVWCGFDKCEIAEEEYEGSMVLVDGTFSVGEYTGKDGAVRPQYTIFAKKVTKYEYTK